MPYIFNLSLFYQLQIYMLAYLLNILKCLYTGSLSSTQSPKWKPPTFKSLCTVSHISKKCHCSPSYPPISLSNTHTQYIPQSPIDLLLVPASLLSLSSIYDSHTAVFVSHAYIYNVCKKGYSAGFLFQKLSFFLLITLKGSVSKMMSQVLSEKSSIYTHCQCLIMLTEQQGRSFFLQRDLESSGYHGVGVCIICVSATGPAKIIQLKQATHIGTKY